jgi:hypothetical protein
MPNSTKARIDFSQSKGYERRAFALGWLAGTSWWIGLLLSFNLIGSVVTPLAPIVGIFWGLPTYFVAMMAFHSPRKQIGRLAFVGAVLGFVAARLLIPWAVGFQMIMMPLFTLLGASLGVIVAFSARRGISR